MGYKLKYYIWNVADVETAQSALDNMNSNSVFPITGRNARTKKKNNNKCKVVRWCKELTYFTNDTVGFPKPETKVLNDLKISVNDRTAWLNTFEPEIINVDDSLFPVFETPGGIAN